MPTTWDLNANGSSGNEELENSMANVLVDVFELWKKRQRKYGVGNIAKFGELGVIIRLSDKLERLINLNFKGEGSESEDESVLDTWLDICDYGAIGLLCHTGAWPGTENEKES